MDAFFTLDLIGTAVFAYTGSVAAKQQRFHILGVLYISFLTAIGGGTLRGVLLQTPELFWMTSSAYFLVVCTVVGASYLIKLNVNRLWFYVLDSQSLAVFVALGVHQTLSQGQPLHIAFAMGVLSGIGGGLIRDAITSQPPQALTDPAYPVIMMAASLGSIVAIQLGMQTWTIACLAALIVVALNVALNYYRFGRLVNYTRPQRNLGDSSERVNNHHSRSRYDSDDQAHENFLAAESPPVSRGTRRDLTRQPEQKTKTGLMAIVHASGVIALSCIAGFYYFNHSITDATANVTANTTTQAKLPAPASAPNAAPDHNADAKIQYLANLHSIEALLTARQADKAEQLIIATRRNNRADHRLESLEVRTRDLKQYLITLDNADLALASNDTAMLQESISLAESLGYSDHRLDTLKMSLTNSLERAAIDTANDNLARKSFNLHLTSAEHHLGLGNIDLAFAEIETAQSFGIESKKLIQISQQIDAAKSFDSAPLTDADFEYAASRFNQLQQAVKLKNLQAISSLTSDNNQRNDLFTGLFDRYVEINARVTELSNENNTKSISATLILENMRLPNGNVTYPPSSYGEITLSVQRSRQGWSKINW